MNLDMATFANEVDLREGIIAEIEALIRKLTSWWSGFAIGVPSSLPDRKVKGLLGKTISWTLWLRFCLVGY